MNDDELGRALGTALAAPELPAVPDAGARLRRRATRRRTERRIIGGSVLAVLALLVTIDVVRVTTGVPPPGRTASDPSAAGYSRLTTPLTIASASGPFGIWPNPCPAPPGLRCETSPALTVDEVAGLSTAELPERGAVVIVTLTADDAATLREIGAGEPGFSLDVRVARAVFRATLAGGRLRIQVKSPRAAEQLIADVGPIRLPAPRTGPGPLDAPLQIWTATTFAPGLCQVSPSNRGVLVANRPGECLVLTGPAVSINSVTDIQLVPPDQTNGTWQVWIELGPPATTELDRYTATHVGSRVAFVVGGHLVGGTPTIQGRFSTTIEVPVADRASADFLISRLRH
jgi:hypothetical protein